MFEVEDVQKTRKGLSSFRGRRGFLIEGIPMIKGLKELAADVNLLAQIRVCKVICNAGAFWY
jgi:hypothetical protein